MHGPWPTTGKRSFVSWLVRAEVVGVGEADVGGESYAYGALGGKGLVGESEEFGGLAGVAAGDEEVHAEAHPSAGERAEQREAKLLYGNAGEMVAEWFGADILELGARLQAERQAVHGAKGVEEGARGFGWGKPVERSLASAFEKEACNMAPRK